MAALRSRLVAAVPGWGWLLLAGCYAAVCWANIVTRTQWLSDSRLYLAWTYRYLGYSEVAAAHRTHNFLVNMDGVTPCGFCWAPGYEHDFFSGANGAVAGARPLYPLLSTPFVALFGPNGMLVVPVLSFALSIVLVALLAHRLWGRHWGLLAGLLLLIPVTVSRYGLYAMTEALAVVLTLVAVMFLPLARRSRRLDLLWFTVALIAGLCTRQFGIALAGGVALAWLVVAVRDRRIFNAWWSFAVAAVGATLVTLVGQSVVTNIWFGGGALDLSSRYQQLTCLALHHCGVRSVPWGVHYIAKADYHYIRTDLALVATVVVAVVAALWRWRSELTALTVGAVLVTAALNLVVVWPSGYRYAVPIHPLILLTGLALIADFAARPRRRPSRSVDVAWPVGIGRPSPGVYLAGWVLAGLTFLGAVVVVWRRVGPDRPRGGLSFLLLAVAFVLLVLLVADRFGASAGILAGIALSLSGLLVSTVLESWRDAVLLAAGAGALALLPADLGTGGGGAAGADAAGPVAAVRALRPSGRLAVLAGLAALATLAAPAGAAVAGGAVVGWAAASVRERRVGNPWALPAAATLIATVVAGAVRVAVAGLSWHPQPLVHLIAADFRTLAPDRVLYLTCVVAAAALVAAWRRPASWYAAGAVAVAAVLHLGAPPPRQVGDFFAAYPALLVAVAGLLAPLGRPAEAAAPARQAVRSGAGH